MLLTISSEDENILMMLDGQISMDDVSNLINDVQKKTKRLKHQKNLKINTEIAIYTNFKNGDSFQPLSTKINIYEIISKTYSNFYHFGLSGQSCIVSEKSLYNEETKGNATITKINVPMFIVKPYIKKH